MGSQLAATRKWSIILEQSSKTLEKSEPQKQKSCLILRLFLNKNIPNNEKYRQEKDALKCF